MLCTWTTSRRPLRWSRTHSADAAPRKRVYEAMYAALLLPRYFGTSSSRTSTPSRTNWRGSWPLRFVRHSTRNPCDASVSASRRTRASVA